MVNIFISHLECDYDYCKELKLHLQNNDSRIANVFLAKDIEMESVINSEKISKLIDISQIFISVMSKEALSQSEPNWLHQELGYAYNHMINHFQKIIIIHDDRKNIKGFINYLQYNLSFNKEMAINNAKQIKETIFGNNVELFPLKLNTNEKPFYVKDRSSLRFSLDNISFSEIKDVSLTIIRSDKEKTISFDNFNKICLSYKANRSGGENHNFISKSVPFNVKKYFDDKFDLCLESVYLYTLHSYSSYDIEIEFCREIVEKIRHNVKFGIMIKAPIHGISIYQCSIEIIGEQYHLFCNQLERDAKIEIE